MHPLRRPRSCGFTLVEILVVVVIIGVLALAVVLSVGSGSERRLAREAERVQALIGYACNRAELTGREIGILLDPAGYGFAQLDLDGWQALPASGELRRRAWPGSLRIELRREGRLVDLAQADGAVPRLVCYSSGELTPFRLELALGDAPVSYRIEGEEDGSVELARVEPSP
jgi:general secretion pathway protein H